MLVAFNNVTKDKLTIIFRGRGCSRSNTAGYNSPQSASEIPCRNSCRKRALLHRSLWLLKTLPPPRMCKMRRFKHNRYQKAGPPSWYERQGLRVSRMISTGNIYRVSHVQSMASSLQTPSFHSSLHAIFKRYRFVT